MLLTYRLIGASALANQSLLVEVKTDHYRFTSAGMSSETPDLKHLLYCKYGEIYLPVIGVISVV